MTSVVIAATMCFIRHSLSKSDRAAIVALLVLLAYGNVRFFVDVRDSMWYLEGVESVLAVRPEVAREWVIEDSVAIPTYLRLTVDSGWAVVSYGNAADALRIYVHDVRYAGLRKKAGWVRRVGSSEWVYCTK